MPLEHSSRSYSLCIAFAACVVHPAAQAIDGTSSETPTVFSPGVISGPVHDTAPAFTPDGSTVYFSRADNAKNTSTILVSHRVGKGWSAPRIAAFSGRWRDMEPAMSPDGSRLVFVSNRPVTPDGAALDGVFAGKSYPGAGGNLWQVRREGPGWSMPIHLPRDVNSDTSIFAPSLAADFSLYFMRADAVSGRFRLWRSMLVDDAYQPSEPLPFSDGSNTDVDPAVAPDESFVVFGSSRPPAQDIDLYIVFRKNGAWGVPRHLGLKVNRAGSDAEARLGPDHRTLYFSSERLAHARGQPPLGSWDNGQYNIWRVSLAPWLDTIPVD